MSDLEFERAAVICLCGPFLVTSLLKPTSSISPGEYSDHEHESMEEDESTEAPERKLSGHAHSQDGSASKEDIKASGVWPPRQIVARSETRNDLLTTDSDIIDRGVISSELAATLLNLYREVLFSEYPGIKIADNVTVDELRSKKPALFMAVMAATSQSMGSALSNKLHEELIYFYARSLFVNGEKSLQHVQALFVSVAFYTPPNNPSQMQIYQYLNLAASMALELGLASKPRTHEQLPKREIRSFQRISSAEELLEHCRTILSLYTLIAGSVPPCTSILQPGANAIVAFRCDFVDQISYYLIHGWASVRPCLSRAPKPKTSG